MTREYAMKRASHAARTLAPALAAALCVTGAAWGAPWTETTKLTASDGAAGDVFGTSVSISGTTAIIGAKDDDDSGSGSGSAYIFEYDGSGWSQAAKLTASDGAASDEFGLGVSISGSTAIAGAYRDGDNGSSSGSAYVFEDGGAGWSQVVKLTPGDAAADDWFGYGVSISGSTAIVGAHGDDDNGTDSGSAYIFEEDGPGWSQVAKLSAGDGEGWDYFGGSVSVSGSTAIVGSCGDDDSGSSSGAAYIFGDYGSGWSQVARLTADDAAEGDYFGLSVSISGSTAIVGARDDDDNGDNSGAAYIFEDDGSGWSQVAKLTAADGAAWDLFGASVAISGTTAAIGAYGDDDSGTDSGSVYIFECDGFEWSQVAKLTAGDGAADDWFGLSVSISDSTALAGAHYDDDNGTDSGSAYTFDVPAQAIPEPSSMLLLAGGLVGVYGFLAKRHIESAMSSQKPASVSHGPFGHALDSDSPERNRPGQPLSS